MSAHQRRQVGDDRVEIVGCGQRDEAPLGAEPDGQVIDALRQLPVGRANVSVRMAGLSP
ncbi:hypothetical protein M2428_002035 [Arthrobacter sp. ES3-54]|nr:hypothetical protein [Arthrobacter sp. ES3-54]MDF9750584.1 hypothetical protein [Arthrobacter sp. ES3-54]